MNLFSRNWQWNCDPFQSKCKRFHEKIHARNDSFHYLEGCKSVCGTYGSIWPQPTGQSVIQHELKAFNIEDLAVKFDPKTTDQFLDEALTGNSYFITGKSLLEALIFASTNPQYDQRVQYTLDLRKILGVAKKFLKSRSFLFQTPQNP